MPNPLADELLRNLQLPISHKLTKDKFADRIKQGKLTRDENPASHFCVFVLPYDIKSRQVLIGHHKKSRLWIFNGGHVDKGEQLLQTLSREIWEELGWKITFPADTAPNLLTITDGINNSKQTCHTRFDSWYFLAVDKNKLPIDQDKMAKEFYQFDWRDQDQARELVIDPATLSALSFLNKH